MIKKKICSIVSLDSFKFELLSLIIANRREIRIKSTFVNHDDIYSTTMRVTRSITTTKEKFQVFTTRKRRKSNVAKEVCCKLEQLKIEFKVKNYHQLLINCA